jgi:hypothetical protein
MYARFKPQTFIPVPSIQLGRIESVKLREVWGDEVRAFTPWTGIKDSIVRPPPRLQLRYAVRSTRATAGCHPPAANHDHNNRGI